MKYIYENGARTFRGYFFWNRQPVDVTDRATLKAIEREEGFRRVDDEKVEEAKADAAPVREPRPILHVPQRRLMLGNSFAKGFKFSPEARARLSEMRRGKSTSLKGKPWSEARRAAQEKKPWR